MQIVGLIAVVLFLAALASFLLAFLNPERVRFGAGLGVLFLALAAILLGVTIAIRRRSERI